MTTEDQVAVAGVLRRAFDDKTRSAVPDDPGLAARLFAEAALAGGDAWVAVDGGVIGLVTFQDRQRPFFAHADVSLLRRVRPLRRAARVLLFFLVFHAVSFPATELYVETMVVDPGAEGRGVGRALLDFADAEARRRGRASLSLYCIRDNVRARALYVRHGYRIVRGEDLWWIAGVLGFRFTDQLRLELPAGDD